MLFPFNSFEQFMAHGQVGECFAVHILPARVNHKLFQTSLIFQYINLF